MSIGCPHCGETVGVSVLEASTVGIERGRWPWSAPGAKRRAAGVVRDCVQCGTRYAVTHDGRVVRYRGGAAAPNDARAGAVARTGGAQDGRARIYDDDLGTLDGGPL